jgi:hypothetical protein
MSLQSACAGDTGGRLTAWKMTHTFKRGSIAAVSRSESYVHSVGFTPSLGCDRTARSSDVAVDVAAQHDPRQRMGMYRVFHHDRAVHDHRGVCATWISVRIGVGGLIGEF